MIDSKTSGNKKTVTRGKSKWGFEKRADTVKYFGDASYSTQPTELYKYDQKGDMIESTEDYRGEFPTDIFKYIYDVRHLLGEKTLSEPDDGRTELLIETCLQYKTFDSAGNWIKRI